MFLQELLSLNSLTSDTDLIKLGEGFSNTLYHDTLNIPTVCYGYNLQNNNAKKQVEKAGGSFDSIIRGKSTSQSVCNNLLGSMVKVSRTDKN